MNSSVSVLSLYSVSFSLVYVLLAYLNRFESMRIGARVLVAVAMVFCLCTCDFGPYN